MDKIDWPGFNESRFVVDESKTEAFDLLPDVPKIAPGTIELVPGEPLATERTALAILEELRAIRARLVPPPEPVRGGGPGCVGPVLVPRLSGPDLPVCLRYAPGQECATCPEKRSGIPAASTEAGHE